MTDALLRRLWRATAVHIVCEVETNAMRVRLDDGSTWWDVGIMVDPHEHCAEVCDMAGELIDLGLEMGVLGRHRDPQRARLVHINASVRAPTAESPTS